MLCKKAGFVRCIWGLRRGGGGGGSKRSLIVFKNPEIASDTSEEGEEKVEEVNERMIMERRKNNFFSHKDYNYLTAVSISIN